MEGEAEPTGETSAVALEEVPSDPEPADAEPSGPSPIGTWVFLVAAIVVFAVQAWPEASYFGDPEIEDATHVMVRMLERSLETYEAAPALRWWERFLYPGAPKDRAAALRWTADEYRSSISWLEETHPHETENEAVLRLYLAPVLGEAGEIEALEEEIRRLEALGMPEAVAWSLRQAYAPVPDAGPTREADVEAIFAEGWAMEVVRARMLEASGQVEAAAAVRGNLAARGHVTERRFRLVAALHWLLIVAGLGVVAAALVQRRARPVLGETNAPLVPWSARDGLGVAVRVFLLLQLVPLLILWIAELSAVVYFLVQGLLSIGVLVLLAHWQLMRARDERISVVWGLTGDRRAWAGWLAAGVAAVALIGVVDQALIGSGLVGAFFPQGSWLEVIDPRDAWFVFGDGAWRASEIIDVVLLGPIEEELLFRGLLFAGLRRRFGFWPSALGSAALFAAVHLYPLESALHVMIVGVVLAAIYERTRSLVPVILAHVLGNALVVLALWPYL